MQKDPRLFSFFGLEEREDDKSKSGEWREERECVRERGPLQLLMQFPVFPLVGRICFQSARKRGKGEN